MSNAWRTTILAMITVLGLLDPMSARGDFLINGSFGPNGDVGFITSPPNLSITFGDGQGSIYQMDGFVNVPGKDLGSGPGQSADLANGAPTGLGYTFNASLATAQQLVLSYQFVNNTGAALNNFQFLYFLDAINGPNFNTGSAAVTGALGLLNPTSYQVGDPSLSSIFTNLMNGTLSNTNDFASPNQGDVSAALGFTLPTLGIGQTATYNVLLSDDGSSLGGFKITQTNPSYPNNVLTISGVLVPEPSSLILVTLGTLAGVGYKFRRRALGHAWTRSQ
jgi:hypothetical protein